MRINHEEWERNIKWIWNQDIQILDNYNQIDYSQYHNNIDYKCLQFESWKSKNILNSKNWIAKILFDQIEIIFKFWDI